ncbi:MerR family DNA-binding transcriptional regulator [Roseiconus nitratireducens]|uniref:MerR family DNA-binding transcriptional regulator n=2 Tax=Roseiconus nitratireducens TaxID=2605748 RepID=A0A5M6CWP5_9BACT|nr:MerR family DNA-binding transcriptional regulator [Roseiconus nitratireducens]
MNRREAANVLQSYQAIVVDLPRSVPSAQEPGWQPPVDLVVIGADQPPLSQTDLLCPELIQAAARGDLEIIHETELWQRLGLVDIEQSVRRFHTPAMLAELVGVSVRVIRRWQRRGLITPVVTLHKLPYFDFAEVATAKRLAGWIAAGASPAAIERRLVDLIEVLPNIRRPLDQLSILVEGKQILLRQGDGLIEPGGQMRFDFDSLDSSSDASEAATSTESSHVLAFHPPDEPPMLRAVGTNDEDDLLLAAYHAEDEDDLETAVEIYHTLLARDGPRAEICFQIAELLYRMNFLVAARERYYVAIELDPEFIEARAGLGGVLAELGEYELAIAALRGTLAMYDGYADVHYTLAKILDKVDQAQQATEHWQRFLQLAPESPWADEARERLGL